MLSREFAVVVEMMGLEPTTPCLQSQIGGGRHLRSWGAAQVEGAVALSVVVRSGPIMTAVNGTVVARPETTFGKACRCWVHLDHRVRAVRVTTAAWASRCRRRGSSFGCRLVADA